MTDRTVPEPATLRAPNDVAAEIERAILKYGRLCILFGVEDERAFNQAGRPNDWPRGANRPYEQEKEAALSELKDLISRGTTTPTLRAPEVTDEEPIPTDVDWHPWGFAAQLDAILTAYEGVPHVVVERSTLASLEFWLRTLPKTVRAKGSTTPKPTPTGREVPNE